MVLYSLYRIQPTRCYTRSGGNLVAVVMPWRETGGRSEGCRATCDALRAILPGVPVLLADSGHEPFNRAASRNLGVKNLCPDDVVVVCDADVLPDASPLQLAVRLAKTTNRVHYPFTVCHYLSEAGTALVLAGEAPDPSRVENTISGAQGGVMVLRVDKWLDMDDDYIGWGYEDNDWYARITRTLGHPVHHEGVLYHLWHPSDRNNGTLQQTENWARARRVMDGRA